MSRYAIYHKEEWSNAEEDRKPFCYADSLDFSDKWMGECVLTVDVSSASPVDFRIGDFIVYLDEKFSIYYDTGVLKQARVNTYGGAFKYSGIKFYNHAVEMKHVRFKNVVIYDNLYYNAGTEFSLHCDTVETLVMRIIENMNRNLPADDQEQWTYVKQAGAQSASDVDITFSNQSCWEVFQMITTQFKTGAYVKGRKIYIGTYVTTGSKALQYGKGKGLVNIERAYLNDDEIVTRLRAYGSTKNMPTAYYSDIFEPMLSFSNSAYPHSGYRGPLYTTLDPLYKDNPGMTNTIKPFESEKFLDEVWLLGVALKIQLSSRQSDIHVELYNGAELKHTLQLHFISTSNKGGEYISLFRTECKGSVFWEKRGESYAPINYTVKVKSGIPASWLRGYKKFWESPRKIAPVGLGIRRLMLPSFLQDDASGKTITDPYIDDTEGIAKYGVREGTVFFDNETVGEIYPTIQDMRADTIREAGYDIVLPDDDNGRMDEILWCITPDDNGYIANNATGTDTKIPETFVMYLKDLGFDMLSYLSTEGNPTIHMMSGECSGFDFEVTGDAANVRRVQLFYKGTGADREYSETMESGYSAEKYCYAWRLVLKRYRSGELSIAFPNNEDGNRITGKLKLESRAGDDIDGQYHSDRFVLLNIEMPSLYINEAAQRLKLAAEEYLQEHNHARSQYNVKLDSVFMQRDYDDVKVKSNSLRYMLRAGTQFKFEDADLDPKSTIKDEKWYVETFNIKESGSRLPEYSVVLKQEVEMSTIQKLNSQIVTLSTTVSSLYAGSDSAESAASNRRGGWGSDGAEAVLSKDIEQTYAVGGYALDSAVAKGTTIDDIIYKILNKEVQAKPGEVKLIDTGNGAGNVEVGRKVTSAKVQLTKNNSGDPKEVKVFFKKGGETKKTYTFNAEQSKSLSFTVSFSDVSDADKTVGEGDAGYVEVSALATFFGNTEKGGYAEEAQVRDELQYRGYYRWYLNVSPTSLVVTSANVLAGTAKGLVVGSIKETFTAPVGTKSILFAFPDTHTFKSATENNLPVEAQSYTRIEIKGKLYHAYKLSSVGLTKETEYVLEST